MAPMRLLIILLITFVFTPTSVSASSVVRTGETVSITTEQSVPGDFYGLGGTVAISGKVEEDLLVAGEQVTINGEIGADVAAVAVGVDVDGIVADDVRIVAGSVTIKGQIAGNLVVFANELTVLSTARVEGDILFFGGSADISGAVGNDVLGTSQSLRLDGEIGGDVDVKTDLLTLGERTRIVGDVTYSSIAPIVRAQNVTIGGKLLRNDIILEEVNYARMVIVPFLIILFSALVWYLLFRKFVVAVATNAQIRPLRAVTIGFGVLFLLPISGSILLFSTLGSLFGIAVLTLYLFLLCAAIALSGVLLGSYVAQFFTKKRQVTVGWIVAGVVTLTLALLIPTVGEIVALGLFLMTLGALSERVYEVFRGN